jgi:cytochrome b561
MIHVSCGISVLVLMVTRCWFALNSRTADSAETQSDGDRYVASGHLVVYLLFIALPLIGIVMMYNRGSDWFAFGLRCRMRRKGILIWWIC